MSLMVWLPLNGDLNNQGLSGISLNSNSTPVFDNNGKIGKCYSTSTYLYNDNYTELSDGIFSVAYWVKYTSFPQYNEYRVSLNGTSSSDYMFMIGVQTTSGLLSVNASSSGTSLSLNKWYHVAYTYDGTTGILYLDGIKIKTWTGFTCNKSATHLTINGRYGSRPIHSGSYLNDVRIYNHCLSAKEVKEISKGLVLHYKLTGNGQENLLKNTNFDSRYTGSGTTSQHTNLMANDWGGYNSGVSNATAVYHAHLTQHDGQYVYRYVKNSSNSWLGISQSITSKTTVGTTYTFSCELYRVSGTNYPHGGHYTKASSTASNSFVTNYSFSAFANAPVGQWIRYSATITVPASSYINDGVYFYIYGHTGGSGEFLMRHPKLEVGSKATSWIPSSSDAIYTSLGFNSTTEYDCSGYNHNGTKVKVTVSTDTPRHKTCNAFLGSTVDNTSNTLTGAAYITAGLPLPASSALTVSWWGKITKYSRGGIFETTGVTSDYVNGTDYSTTAIANWDSTFRVYNGSSYVNLYSNMGIPNSSWQLNTITFDGANVKYYKNGALISTNALTGTLPAFNGIKIGIGKAGGVYRQIQQYVSDFRIYVTALSADDIKELYQIPIAVDKSGNAFASEFIEDQKPEFEKTGIMENSYIHENEADDSDSLATFHIGKTKTFANQIIEV